MTTDPMPCAYGLLNVHTGRLRTPNVYVKQEAAEAAAAAKTSKFVTLVAVPLFGPEAIVAATEAAVEEARVAKVQAEGSAHGERNLRAENIALRNEIATLRGRLMAEKHGHV
jgi:hypothetical protein